MADLRAQLERFGIYEVGSKRTGRNTRLQKFWSIATVVNMVAMTREKKPSSCPFWSTGCYFLPGIFAGLARVSPSIDHDYAGFAPGFRGFLADQVFCQICQTTTSYAPDFISERVLLWGLTTCKNLKRGYL